MDWWSLGTLIYEMTTGLPPFYDKNRRLMYNKILTAPLQKSSIMSADISFLFLLLARIPSLSTLLIFVFVS